jgi:hypothetical protein
MERITYSKEIRRAIIHFIAAMDGVKIQRFDSKGNVQDTIKVGIGFHPKSPIFKDLINNSGHIVLPYIVVKMNNITYDNSRSWNKTHQMSTYREKDNKILNYTCPVPVNLDFELEITTVYYEDLFQILTNFIPYSNPYVYVKMQEPFTGAEMRCPIEWNGQIPLQSADELTPSDNNRYKATTGFTFKTWIFKAKEEEVSKICCIDWAVDLDKTWESYTRNPDKTEDSGHISGIPLIKSVAPYIIKLGETSKIEMIGEKFDKVHTVLLSANSSMFGALSTYNFFPNSDTYVSIKGKSIDFSITDDFLSFEVLPKNEGFFDVILVNSCGYLKLTNPVDTRKYTLSSNCYGDTVQNLVTTDNVFDTFASDCTSCFLPFDQVFEHGIEVTSPWNSACSFSECLSALLPTDNNCDK